MKVLITGGSGVLGKALVEAAAREEWHAVLYDLKPPASDFPGRFSFIHGDIRDKANVQEAVSSCDAVFHLAALLPQAKVGEEIFHEVNVEGTKNVAFACLQSGVKRLIFASTIEIYGAQKIKEPLTEESPKLFTGIYSRNKWECEEFLRELRKTEGLDFAALRMPLILGPGFYHEKTYLMLFNLIHRGLPVCIPAENLPFHVLSSYDAACAFFSAAQKDGVSGESFNIAAKDYPSVGEALKEFILRVHGGKKRKSPVFGIPMPLVSVFIRLGKLADRFGVSSTPAELMDYALTGGAYDISKAKSMLGYEPVHSCADALELAYRWVVREK